MPTIDADKLRALVPGSLLREWQDYSGAVCVAMSGGVDSSTVAAVLKSLGHETVGMSLRLYEPEGEQDSGFDAVPAFGSCCSLDDLAQARRQAMELGIPHYTLDFVEAFSQHVYQYFLAEYESGRTPSPCVKCNDTIKFDHLFDVLEEVDADLVATGHYARIKRDTGVPELWRGVDPVKDQSYFLSRTPAEKLARIVFPFGELTKVEVRNISESMGLRSAAKKDSQDLCFIPDGDTQGFLDKHVRTRTPGRILAPDGAVMGTHPGIHRFTLGQRKGLGVAWRAPLYVRDIQTDGDVHLAERDRMYAAGLELEDPVWIQEPSKPGDRVLVQSRYRTSAVPATLQSVSDDSLVVTLEEPVFAPAPGQLAALYQGDKVLGGAFIRGVHWDG